VGQAQGLRRKGSEVSKNMEEIALGQVVVHDVSQVVALTMYCSTATAFLSLFVSLSLKISEHFFNKKATQKCNCFLFSIFLQQSNRNDQIHTEVAPRSMRGQLRQRQVAVPNHENHKVRRRKATPALGQGVDLSLLSRSWPAWRPSVP